MLGKKLGKRALFIGALAQSVPDVDFISSFWNDASANLLAHRGFTHSLFFDFLFSFLLALIGEHYHKKHKISFHQWVFFFFIQITTHLFLDLFNSYGMGLFEPFSHVRVSFDVLFVADPFFSIVPAVAFIVLSVVRSKPMRRKFWWRLGVGWCLSYLSYCCFNKLKIDHEVEAILEKQAVIYKSYFTTPTPLNNWLWYIAVKTDSGFYIGYRSVFDRKKNIDFHFFPSNEYLLRQVSDHQEVQRLVSFSKNYFTLEHWNDTLVFNDLRFGQMIGWYNPHERFVFHYYLQHQENANRLVVQRGRFAKWNGETVRSLIKRIAGE